MATFPRPLRPAECPPQRVVIPARPVSRTRGGRGAPAAAPAFGSDNAAHVNIGVVRFPELPAPARGGASHLFASGTSAPRPRRPVTVRGVRRAASTSSLRPRPLGPGRRRRGRRARLGRSLPASRRRLQAGPEPPGPSPVPMSNRTASRPLGPACRSSPQRSGRGRSRRRRRRAGPSPRRSGRGRSRRRRRRAGRSGAPVFPGLLLQARGAQARRPAGRRPGRRRPREPVHAAAPAARRPLGKTPVAALHP